MDSVKKESILFLSRMAERQIDSNLLKIEHLHQYTNIVKHISGVQTLKPLSQVEQLLQYVNFDVFNDYPALRAELDGLSKQIDFSKEK